MFKKTESYDDFQAHIAGLLEISMVREPSRDEWIEMNRIGPVAFEITAFLAGPAQVVARQAYFPTWALTDIETGAEIPIGPSQATGLIRAALPAGKSQLRLSIEPARPEKIGSAVSAIATFLCAMVLLMPIIRSWRLGKAYASQVVGKMVKTAARLCSPLFDKRN